MFGVSSLGDGTLRVSGFRMLNGSSDMCQKDGGSQNRPEVLFQAGLVATRI